MNENNEEKAGEEEGKKKYMKKGRLNFHQTHLGSFLILFSFYLIKEKCIAPIFLHC